MEILEGLFGLRQQPACRAGLQFLRLHPSALVYLFTFYAETLDVDATDLLSVV